MTKLEWNKPELETLDVSKTLGGDPNIPVEGDLFADNGDVIETGPLS